MSQHQIDPDNLPYHPEKLLRKEYVSVNDYFSLDMRSGKIIDVSEYPEMRKPSYKIRVDFGPLIGELSSSAQITNYSRSELIGRLVVGVVKATAIDLQSTNLGIKGTSVQNFLGRHNIKFV